MAKRQRNPVPVAIQATRNRTAAARASRSSVTRTGFRGRSWTASTCTWRFQGPSSRFWIDPDPSPNPAPKSPNGFAQREPGSNCARAVAMRSLGTSCWIAIAHSGRRDGSCSNAPPSAWRSHPAASTASSRSPEPWPTSMPTKALVTHTSPRPSPIAARSLAVDRHDQSAIAG